MFAGALVLIALRMPVGVAMLLVGGVGYAAINGADPLLNTLKTLTFSKFANYTLTVIPLFLLMGEFATKAGMSAALYRAGRAWFGHWRGGLAVATIGGCAAFGAICGSSIATAATMTKVAGPEMRKAGYSPALWTGTLAAGGTLGILIPPSVILVIYAVFTEQSIGALFIAAMITSGEASSPATFCANSVGICEDASPAEKSSAPSMIRYIIAVVSPVASSDSRRPCQRMPPRHTASTSVANAPTPAPSVAENQPR